MQELRSTDILDKEIKADALRKAESILARAEEECQQILNSVDEKIEAACLEKKEFYAKKVADYERDFQASIPLEKQRFEVNFVQNAVISSINAYLEGLSEEKRLELVTKNFDFSMDKVFNAYVYGFDSAAVEKFLSKKLGKKLASCQKTDFGKIIIEDDIGLENNEGIILEAEDKSVRCRLTLVEVINHILDKNRSELSDCLFSNVGGNK